MSSKRNSIGQLDGVEDLYFTRSMMSGVCEKRVLIVGREGTESNRIRGSVPDSVHQFHVADVVDVETLL